MDRRTQGSTVGRTRATLVAGGISRCVLIPIGAVLSTLIACCASATAAPLSAVAGSPALAGILHPAPPSGPVSSDQAAQVLRQADPGAVGPSQSVVVDGQTIQPTLGVQQGTGSQAYWQTTGGPAVATIDVDPTAGFQLTTSQGIIGFAPLVAGHRRSVTGRSRRRDRRDG